MTMTNRYTQKCLKCGQEVPAYTGRLFRWFGSWEVEHPECESLPFPERRATVPAMPPRHRRTPEVPAGHYAIPSERDGQDLDFYRVGRPKGRWEGYTFVTRVVEGRPSYRVREYLNVLERIVQAGIAESATRYGLETGRCYRCNRHLTDETSRKLGIGPECRKS